MGIELSIQEQAAGLVMPGFKFGVDEPELADRLVDLGVGGFCLYHGSVPEVAAFTRRLQERARRPLLFSADYEDGAAQHVAGGTPLVSNMGVGASGDPELAALKARVTAAEAWALGVRWVLAPVADLATVAVNPIVNTRAFGDEPERVARLGKAYCAGLRSRRVLSCIKHFPGHGETRSDSHLELPVLRRTRAQLLKSELLPFRALADAADTAMMGHLSIPALGDRGPSSLSPKATALLRKTLGFKKLIATDALSMQAIARHFTDEAACVAALMAGVDVLLVPSDPLKAVYGFLK
ncbi:MAG: beta-glucosidase, partial [Elusimicrobia bacterium]|nr:beta-glucosidase [Elusimicrobiota bacterium]